MASNIFNPLQAVGLWRLSYSTLPPFISLLPHIFLGPSLPLSLYIPSFPHRGLICSSIILTLVALSWFSPLPSIPQPRYGLSASWFFYLPVVEKLLLHDPEQEFWRVHEGSSKGKEDEKVKDDQAEAMKMPPWSWSKFKWAMALAWNPRGVGWNCECKGIRQGQPRNEKPCDFVWTQFFRFVLIHIGMNAGMLYMRSLPATPETFELAKMGLIAQRELGFASMAFFSWNWQWALAAFVSVASGLSAPKDWPPFFGRPSTSLTSLRSFWGRFWQGNLHTTLLGFSRFLNKALHIPRGTLLSYIIHLLTGFSITALFHVVSISVIKTEMSIAEIAKWCFLFFEAQAVGIAAETLFEGLWRRCGWRKRVEESAKEREKNARRKLRVMKAVEGVITRVWTLGFLLATGWWILKPYAPLNMEMWDIPLPVVQWALDWYKPR